MADAHNFRAFPSSAIDDRLGGMSLLDWFAGQALLGEVGAPSRTAEACARHAYQIAEAMMAERAKRVPVTDAGLTGAALKLHRAGHLGDADLARIINRIDAIDRLRKEAKRHQKINSPFLDSVERALMGGDGQHEAEDARLRRLGDDLAGEV